MSEQNINNFSALIKDKQIFKEVTEDALLAFGVKNKNAVSGYSPIGIKVSDFIKQVLDGSPNPIVSPPVIDINTWNMPGVAIVDPVNGKDSTAIVGDGNKPFKTINSALTQSLNVLSLGGTVLETIPFIDGMNLHCLGTKFVAGSKFYNPDSTVKTCHITGNAVFLENSDCFESHNDNLTLYAEFDYAEDVRWFVSSVSNSKFFIKCNWVRCHSFNGTGYSILARNSVKMLLDIKLFYHVQHTVIDVRNATDVDVTINCPDIRCLKNYYPQNYGGSSHKVVSIVAISEGKVVINGDYIGIEYPSYTGTINGGIITYVNFAVSHVGFTTIINAKNINSGLQHVISSYSSSKGVIQLNGCKTVTDVTVTPLSLNVGRNDAGVFEVALNDCYVKGSKILIGRGNNVFFNNCKFKNIEGIISDIILFDDLTYPLAPPSNIFFTNCLADAFTGSNLVTDAGTSFVGVVNTTGTPSFGNGVDTYLGYTQQATLLLPS